MRGKYRVPIYSLLPTHSLPLYQHSTPEDSILNVVILHAHTFSMPLLPNKIKAIKRWFFPMCIHCSEDGVSHSSFSVTDPSMFLTDQADHTPAPPHIPESLFYSVRCVSCLHRTTFLARLKLSTMLFLK